MEGFNYSRHIDFLEKHFVTPFLNRALYRNSGQIRDKIPFGLVLYGEDKVAKNLLVAALKYELGIRGENYFCTRKPNRWQQIYDAGLLCSYGNYVAIRCIKDAQLVQNSMIYLEDIDESSSNRDICCDCKIVLNIIHNQIAYIYPCHILCNVYACLKEKALLNSAAIDTSWMLDIVHNFVCIIL